MKEREEQKNGQAVAESEPKPETKTVQMPMPQRSMKGFLQEMKEEHFKLYQQSIVSAFSLAMKQALNSMDALNGSAEAEGLLRIRNEILTLQNECRGEKSTKNVAE